LNLAVHISSICDWWIGQINTNLKTAFSINFQTSNLTLLNLFMLAYKLRHWAVYAVVTFCFVFLKFLK